MKIFRSHLEKMILVVLVGMMCLDFHSTGNTVYAQENSTYGNVNVSVEAFLENDDIIVEVTPDMGFLSKFINTMNNTQIWGDYGRGWFLIKDYNITIGKNQRFTWDLQSLDHSNEEGAISYVKGDTDRLRFYVRYRKKINGNCDHAEELYKTFYLGNQKQDVQLLTNKEEQRYTPVSYDFPVVVQQDQKVELYLDPGSHAQKEYTVKILGDGHSEKVNKKKNSKAKNQLIWTPKESGTFYIAVYDGAGQLVVQRKAYVNSSNGRYLQLDELSIKNINDTVCVRLKVAEGRPSGFQGQIDKSLQFVISEPQVWSKTIKDYGEAVVYNTVYSAYEIKENREEDHNFTLGSGRYFISASIKTPHSLEYDDKITKTYMKTGQDNIAFEIDHKANRKPDRDGSYSLLSCEPLKFEFQVKKVQPGYEYAFFLQDARGKRYVKEYSEDSTFTWMPADTGEYKLYGRVRKKERTGSLSNSYEKEVSIPIRISCLDRSIELKEVCIENRKWDIEKGKVVEMKGDGRIKAHTLNVIEIDAQQNIIRDMLDMKGLMYKVCVVTKGHYYSLSPYTFSKYIPFYPKNTGEYKVIIMVKGSKSGAYEDCCEFSLNVE